MTDPVALPLTLPLPSSLSRAAVDRALAELGLNGDPLLRVKTITIGWGGIRIEIHAEGPDGRAVRSVDGSRVAIDSVTIPIVEG